MTLGVALLLPIAAASVVACGGSDGPAEDSSAKPSGNDKPSSSGSGFGNQPTGDGGDGTEAANECGKMDLVFVVDNSGSMEQEQANLATNFPKFANIIDGYKTKSGNALDYRLAVTTTDAKKGKGAFIKEATAESGGILFPPSSKPKCAPGPDRRWLERTDGTVSDFFACRAQVGTGGSGNEQPLASILLGLTDRIADGTNTAAGASFLRDDALLAFVVLTDEDEAFDNDKSSTLPKTIAEFPPAFDKVKGGERGRWAAAVIAGEQACQSKGFGNANEAKELKTFIQDVGKNGVFASICTGDLTEGLTKALGTFDAACKSFPGGPK